MTTIDARDSATRLAQAHRDYLIRQARENMRLAREIERAYGLARVELAQIGKASDSST
jgi:uncharacterized protein (UPF0128 family)